MLVFAVAILVHHHVGSGVRLITSLAQRQTDVTKILRDVLIQRLRLFFLGGAAFDDLFGFELDFFVGHYAIALQRGVPLPDFIPTLKSRHLHVRMKVVSVFLFVFRFVAVFVFILVFLFAVGLEVRVLPRVNAPAVLFFDRGIEAGFGL